MHPPIRPRSVRMRPRRRRRQLPFVPWLLAAAFLAAGALLLPLPQPRRALPPVAANAAALPAAAAAPVAAPPQRLVAEPPPPPAEAATRTFAWYVEQLVAIGATTSRLAAAGDEAAARQSDEAAQALFAEMLERIADADEQALAAIAGGAMPPRTAPPPEQLRWRVYALTVDAGLQRRFAAVAAAGRQRLDHLVTAILALLPQDPALAANLGRPCLCDRPFLGAAHEAAVLSLCAEAGQGGIDAELATALLLTLWRNLVEQGARGEAEVANQALVLLADANACLRAAACQLLLQQDRFRELVLQQVRERQDPALARQLAMAAAGDMPPATAVAVLRRLQATAGDLMPAFLLLGSRADGVLTAAYEQTLADGVDPQFRAELVSGAGFAGSPQGLQLAQLAFASDPHPEVRTRALFVLTGNAADALGERSVDAAIDDAVAREDRRELGAIVLALENLERAGLVNAIDRLGQRLRACPLLRDGDRANLERLLARALPGGRTSR